MELMYIFLAIIGLFAGLLIAKHLISLRFCVMCLSVSITWLILLILYWTGIFHNPTLLALLMGQSIVGVYYLAEKKLPEKYMIFRVAGLLTMTYAAYVALTGFDVAAAFLIIVLWLGSSLLYAYRNSPHIKSTVDHIVACCRDW